jgi:type IV pilus assembly protein PilM
MRAGIRSRPWLGLDVGSYSVKLLASQGNVGGMQYWVAETVLPPSEGKPDVVHGREVVARAIGECMSQVGFSARSFRGITAGISGAEVIIKQISLPLLADDEVGSALRFEARKHLPFDPQGMVIDFQIIGRYPSEKRLDVLLAAVTQEHVERSLAPLRMLGVDADILDPAPLALTNALVSTVSHDQQPYLLLDIGHLSSHLTLHQRGEPYFSRRLEFGGKSLSDAIAGTNRVSFEEAEEWKLAAGSDEPGFRVDWDSPEMNAMFECLRRDLVEELRRTFAFYRTVGNLSDTMQLWISGGTARLPGLAERLHELLELPVQLFNPLESLPRDPHGGNRSAVAPQFAQAFGLVLRTA